jgi:hypothetical protein
MRVCRLLQELIALSAFFGLTGLAAAFTELYDREGCDASPTSPPSPT